MVDGDGDFVGEVCHIEAAEAGGQRFNRDRTNEENRDISNLMLMCPTHHTKTNNVELFPVSRLVEIKSKHEAKFLDIGEKIAHSISDSTDANVVVPAINMKRFNRVLDLKLDQDDLDDLIKSLGSYAAALEHVPEPSRQFLGAIAARIYKMRDTGAVYERYGTYKISVTDIEQSLTMTGRAIEEKCLLLDNYELASLDSTDDHEMPWVVSIRSLGTWALWFDLAKFAKSEGIDFSTFWRDLDFSSLDE